MSEIRSQRMEGREGEKSRKAEGQSEGEGRRTTPVKYAPVRFSEPTPDEHPKGTRFNRAGGINFARHLRAPVKQKKTEWLNGVKISTG